MKFSTILGGTAMFALGAFVGSWWAVDRTLAYLADPEQRDELLALVDWKKNRAEAANESNNSNS